MQPLLDLQQHARFPQLGPGPPFEFQEAGAGPLVLQHAFTETASNSQHVITEGPEKLTVTRPALGDQNLPAVKVHERRTDWRHTSNRHKLATKPML